MLKLVLQKIISKPNNTYKLKELLSNSEIYIDKQVAFCFAEYDLLSNNTANGNLRITTNQDMSLKIDLNTKDIHLYYCLCYSSYVDSTFSVYQSNYSFNLPLDSDITFLPHKKE